jgi:hypothetical protein
LLRIRLAIDDSFGVLILVRRMRGRLDIQGASHIFCDLALNGHAEFSS